MSDTPASLSDTTVRTFSRPDRDQVTHLANAHAAAVIPGASISVSQLLGTLERDPGEFFDDPWVTERVTLVAEQRQRMRSQWMKEGLPAGRS